MHPVMAWLKKPKKKAMPPKKAAVPMPKVADKDKDKM